MLRKKEWLAVMAAVVIVSLIGMPDGVPADGIHRHRRRQRQRRQELEGPPPTSEQLAPVIRADRPRRRIAAARRESSWPVRSPQPTPSARRRPVPPSRSTRRSPVQFASPAPPRSSSSRRAPCSPARATASDSLRSAPARPSSTPRRTAGSRPSPRRRWLCCASRMVDLADRHGVFTTDLVFSAPVDAATVRPRLTVSVLDAMGRELPVEVLSAVAQDEPGHVGCGWRAHAWHPGARSCCSSPPESPPPTPAARPRPRRRHACASPRRADRDQGGLSGRRGRAASSSRWSATTPRWQSKRWYWDRTQSTGYDDLSSRCLLDEASVAEHLRFEPAVPVTVAPSAGGFRIFGAFERGSYALHLDAGARTVDGGVLRRDWDGTVSIPARSPQVAFVAHGRYLPHSAWRALPVRHLNLDRLRLTVRHVPPQNLVFWMGDDDDETATERTSDVVYRDFVAVDGPPDRLRDDADRRRFAGPGLDSGPARADPGGARRCPATPPACCSPTCSSSPSAPAPAPTTRGAPRCGSGRSTRARWRRPPAPRSRWCARAASSLARCTTDGDGSCVLRGARGGTSTRAPPFALLATHGDDLTYLKFADLEEQVQEARVAGEPYRSAAAVSRGALRRPRRLPPGRDGAPGGDRPRRRQRGTGRRQMPVQLELADPQGKILRRDTLRSNAAGIVDRRPRLRRLRHHRPLRGAAVGRRLAGGDPHLPGRGVRSRADEGRGAREHARGGAASAPRRPSTCHARYLFGGVPAGHKVELTCELEPATLDPEGERQLRVRRLDPRGERPLDPARRRQRHARRPGRRPPRLPLRRRHRRAPTGPAASTARLAVFEAGSGRTTVGRATVAVHPAPYYLGLWRPAPTSSPGRRPAGRRGSPSTGRGTASARCRQVDVEILASRRSTAGATTRPTGRETYRSYLRPVPIDTQHVAGRRRPLPHRLARRPRRRVVPGAGPRRRGAHRAADRRPGRLVLLGPRGEPGRAHAAPRSADLGRARRPAASARVGDEVTVTLKAPYSGRLLLTAETDEIARPRLAHGARGRGRAGASPSSASSPTSTSPRCWSRTRTRTRRTPSSPTAPSASPRCALEPVALTPAAAPRRRRRRSGRTPTCR